MTTSQPLPDDAAIAAVVTLTERSERPGTEGSLSSYLSAGSILSTGSAGSILSIGSAGSILSIGSVGSMLSIGSAGSILSIGSVGSILSRGSRRKILAVHDEAMTPSQIFGHVGLAIASVAAVGAVAVAVTALLDD